MPDPLVEDLQSFIATGKTMVEELTDQAFSGNIHRLHHLAFECFDQARTVLTAMMIAHDFLQGFEAEDEPSASQVEGSHDTHNTSHDTHQDVQDA